MTTNVYPAEPWDLKFKKQSAGDNLKKKKKRTSCVQDDIMHYICFYQSMNKCKREQSVTIFIASVNVTLNSLRILAWLFNLLLQACSGGAALSKSNYKKASQTKQNLVSVEY